MRHYSYLLIALCLLVGLATGVTRKTVRIGTVEEKEILSHGNFAPAVLWRIATIADDIDSSMAAITTLETATGGVTADTLYKTAVKAARLRGDSIVGTGSQFTRLRGDSIVSTVIKTTRVRSDSSIITATLITRLRADSSLITAQKSTRSRPSYLIADSIQVAGGAVIKAFTITDATNDTLVITVGAKTWKFLPVADQ